MNKLQSLNFEDEDLHAFVQQNILIIHIKKNAFEIVTDLSESDHLFALLDLAEKKTEIRAIFIYNTSGVFDDLAYDSFLRKIFNLQKESDETNFANISDQSARKRQINILNHFISYALNYKKILTIGLQGGVVTPFFGASLACDLRFVTPDMKYSLAHLKYGLHPTGALPFLLPQFIGYNSARYYLYKGGTISAEQALKIDLVSKILPSESFVEQCLSTLKTITRYDTEVMTITKKLLNTRADDLQKYFEFEAKNTVVR
jgi:enoyl-CoA hydratase/carnithine racemase